ITRVPLIFEYLYRNFQLAANEENLDGHYILETRAEPRNLDLQDLQFTTNRSGFVSGILKLTQPTACGLIRFDVTIAFSPAKAILRPSGIELSFRHGPRTILTTLVTPLDRDFTTYVSLLNPLIFYKVFTNGIVPARSWDTIAYSPKPTDILGT